MRIYTYRFTERDMSLLMQVLLGNSSKKNCIGSQEPITAACFHSDYNFINGNRVYKSNEIHTHVIFL